MIEQGQIWNNPETGDACIIEYAFPSSRMVSVVYADGFKLTWNAEKFEKRYRRIQ